MGKQQLSFNRKRGNCNTGKRGKAITLQAEEGYGGGEGGGRGGVTLQSDRGRNNTTLRVGESDDTTISGGGVGGYEHYYQGG